MSTCETTRNDKHYDSDLMKMEGKKKIDNLFLEDSLHQSRKDALIHE